MYRTFRNFGKQLQDFVIMLLKILILLLGLTTRCIGGDDAYDFQNNSEYIIFW